MFCSVMRKVWPNKPCTTCYKNVHAFIIAERLMILAFNKCQRLPGFAGATGAADAVDVIAVSLW